jgi:hypothetical protein
VVGCCKHGNERLGSVKSSELLTDCWLSAIQGFHFIWAILSCMREYRNMEMNESYILVCILT